MKKDREQSSFVNIGSSSLLIVFLVLCLATFAILSLSSAKSDYSLSERLAKHKTLYYGASSEAEAVLDEIDATLEETAQENESGEAGLSGASASSEAFLSSPYAKAVAETFEDARLHGYTVSCRPQEEGLFLSYEIPAEEEQILKAELLVTNYTEHDTYYEIKKWQITSTGSWESDNTLHLMPMEGK